MTPQQLWAAWSTIKRRSGYKHAWVETASGIDNVLRKTSNALTQTYAEVPALEKAILQEWIDIFAMADQQPAKREPSDVVTTVLKALRDENQQGAIDALCVALRTDIRDEYLEALQAIGLQDIQNAVTALMRLLPEHNEQAHSE